VCVSVGVCECRCVCVSVCVSVGVCVTHTESPCVYVSVQESVRDPLCVCQLVRVYVRVGEEGLVRVSECAFE